MEYLKKGLEKVDYTKELGQDISGMKIGIPKEFIEENAEFVKNLDI